jgi:competence/damage-inducible protein CinA-like protein
LSDNLSAEIVAIGTEILLGEITDTNSVYLAQVMRDYGINVFYMQSVGDNVQRIASAIQIAMSRADIVITCGGLGPTIDDMTRQGVALATERELVFSEDLFEQIRTRFNSFQMQMPENNRRQAYLPANAIAIENPVGTAPSFITEHKGKVIITLPGVPRELKYLMREKVVPFLQSRYTLGLIRARILRVAGIGESALDELIGQALLETSNPTVGLAAHHGVIDVRITAKGENENVVEPLLDMTEKQVMERVGDYVFGRDKDTIEETLLQQLVASNQKLAVVEAGLTGLSKLLSSKPQYGQVVAAVDSYDHPQGVYHEHSLASTIGFAEVAKQVASTLGSKYGNAIVILSDPNVVESADSEQATVVAIHARGETLVRGYGFGAKSELAQAWVSRWGLANIWRLNKGK